MEDAAEALKMAFSVFAFIIALGLAFTTFNQSKRVSDIVISASDRTYIEAYTEADIEKNKDGRIVGAETVIPNLYRYYKEKYSIEIAHGNENNRIIENVFDLDTEQQYRDGKVGKYEKYKDSTTTYDTLYPSGIHWIGSRTNTDAKLRVDYFISNKEKKINGEIIELNDNKFDFNDTYYQKFEETKTGTRYSIKKPNEPDYDGTYVTEESGTTKINMTFTKN